MSILKRKEGQVSLEMVIVAGFILVFAVYAGKYLKDRGNTEMTKMTTGLNQASGGTP